MSAETLLTLETNGIILSCLSGLWGVYLALFVLAIWSTHQQGTATSKRLRWVTIVLFLDLLLHFITRSLQFARARLQIDTDAEARMWGIPLVFIGNFTGTISGLLSDGTLAWRFYIIFDRERWALYLPAIWVIMNACLCWSVDFQALAYYERPELYLNNLLPVTMKIAMAWGWSMFCCNSFMTGGIIGKILWTKNAADSLRESRRVLNRYAIALRVIIESALVTWIGILLLEIGMLGPSKGHVVVNQNIGYIMLSTLPPFYGVSQTLIAARLGIVKETRTNTTDYSMSSQGQPGGQSRF